MLHLRKREAKGRKKDGELLVRGADCPEKTIAPHSSTLAWKIPWMEEPGGL